MIACRYAIRLRRLATSKPCAGGLALDLDDEAPWSALFSSEHLIASSSSS